MLLLDHVSIAVRDLSAARPFYDAVMTALRPDYHPGYFAAFVDDPEGDRLEAARHLVPPPVRAT